MHIIISNPSLVVSVPPNEVHQQQIKEHEMKDDNSIFEEMVSLAGNGTNHLLNVLVPICRTLDNLFERIFD